MWSFGATVLSNFFVSVWGLLLRVSGVGAANPAPSFFADVIFLERVPNIIAFAGQIHSATEPAARPENHGAEGRGLPLLQAHAGQRAARHAPHGDAARQEAVNEDDDHDEDERQHQQVRGEIRDQAERSCSFNDFFQLLAKEEHSSRYQQHHNNNQYRPTQCLPQQQLPRRHRRLRRRRRRRRRLREEE